MPSSSSGNFWLSHSVEGDHSRGRNEPDLALMINGGLASADGPIKTFPRRGIKDSPPYLHDDRLLTLEDTVEFFNILLEIELSNDEKADIVAFLRCL